MKTEEKLDAQLHDLCRLCLKRFSDNSNKDLQNIYFNKENISLTMRIMATTAIEVQQGDGLPEKVCTDCRIQLEKSYYFRKKSKNSDAKLRRHIRLINAGKHSEIDEIDHDEELDEYKDSLDFFASLDQIERDEREQLKCKQDADLQKIFEEKLELELKRVHADNEIEIKQYKLNVVKLKRQLKQQLQTNKEQQETNETIKKKLLKNQKLLKSVRSHKEKLDNIKDTRIQPPMTTNNKLSVKTAKNNTSINSNHKEQSFIKLNKANTLVTQLYDDLTGNDDDQISIIPCEFSDSQTIDEHYIQAFTIPHINKKNNNNDGDGDGDFEHMDEDGNGDSNAEGEVDGEDENYNYDNEYINENDDNDNDPQMDADEYEEEEVHEYGDDDDGVSKKSIPHSVEENNMKEEDDDDENVVFCLESRNNNTDSYILCTSKTEYLKGIKGEEYTEIDVTTSSDGNIVDVDLKREKQIISKEKLIPSPAAIFRCIDCTAAFTRYNQLAKHARIHSGGFTCFACFKWFKTQSALARHERIHTGEKPFICAICERGFVQKEILKRHLATHTGVKPFHCKFCNMGFTQKQVLALHINSTHTKNPIIHMHRCELCPKTFRHASGLSRHLIVHTGRSYDCEYCNRQFNDASALKRHIQALHIKKNIKLE